MASLGLQLVGYVLGLLGLLGTLIAMLPPAGEQAPMLVPAL